MSREDMRERTSLLDLPAKTTRAWPLVAGSGALLLHGLVLGASLLATPASRQASDAHPPTRTAWIQVDVPAQREGPAPAVDDGSPAPAPMLRPARARPAPARPSAAPPPAAAQAGQGLVASPELVDFGETVVVGGADQYAGGTTELRGTATKPALDPRARAGGETGGNGTDGSVDLSCPPALAGGARWDCPFPAEAADDGIDHAMVALRVEVDAEGRVMAVRVLSEPGHGFSRESIRCARNQRWTPGRNRAGRPVRSAAIVNVTFRR